jgi:5'-3' exonuclease
MSYKTLLIDLPSVYYRAFYALPESLTDKSGMPANAIKGTISIIANIAENLSISEVIGTLDENWRPSWRVTLLPQYKSQRVDPLNEDTELSPTGLDEQVQNLITILLLLGMTIYEKSDYEADDVLATLSKQYSNALIVTGDRDLFQLIDKRRNVGVYLLSDKNNPIYDEARFIAEFEFNPKSYLDYAVLKGDPSDGLPGVPGVGKVSAQKMISKYSNIADLIAHLKAAEKSKLSKSEIKILDSEDYLAKALRVSKVVDDLTLTLVALPEENSDLSDLITFFKIEKQVSQYQKFIH